MEVVRKDEGADVGIMVYPDTLRDEVYERGDDGVKKKG